MPHDRMSRRAAVGSVNKMVDEVLHPWFQGETEVAARVADITAHSLVELATGYSEKTGLKKILRYGIPWSRLVDLDS